jgi:hypothetical protein
MQHLHLTQPKIEPFEYQNRSIYRDLLRLMTTVREAQQEIKTDLGKIFLHDLFDTLFSLSKDIGYSSINEDGLVKMGILGACINKTFDCLTSLDICFEAHWIPSLQYFESKQILEKAYWAFRDDQQVVLNDFKNNKQFQ